MSLVLTSQEAQNLLTQSVVALLDRRSEAPSFLTSMFRQEERNTLGLVVKVRRNKQLVAVDVPRGSEGKLLTATKGSATEFIPPYYRYYIVMNSLKHYYTVFGTNEVGLGSLEDFIRELTAEIEAMIAMIKRAHELQCADVFEDGIVTLADGTQIDFGRKSGSKVDLSATPWSSNTYNPLTHLATAAQWVCDNGQINSPIVDVIMGESVLPAFMANTNVTASADIKDIKQHDIKAPIATSTGGAFHGVCTIGSRLGRLWSYSAKYEAANGTLTNYLNPKKVIVKAADAELVFGHAAVPQVLDLSQRQLIRTGAFVTDDYIDKAKTAHIYDVKNAGLAIPVGVDEFATLQVLA